MRKNKTKREPQQIDAAAGAGRAIGNTTLLKVRKLALICSQACPADIILQAYDFARLVRRSALAVVSGFHSPIEKDCLPILLRGSGPIIIVPGHRLGTTRLALDWQKAIDAGRLLVISPFRDKQKRVTAELAVERNRFVAAISDEVLIAYAGPGSRSEALGLDLLKSGRRVYTFCKLPGALLDSGARVVAPDFLMPPKGESLHERNTQSPS